MLLSAVKSARPHQWVKNLFVAAPLVFARRVGDPGALGHTALAVVAFCLLSSSVYFINDLVDIDKDRAHPIKRHRPIASGAVPLSLARLLAAVLALGGLAIGAALSAFVAVIALAYLVLNLAYSLRLKRIAFVDVGCLSLGFLLRVLAGSAAIPVVPSKWLLLCTFLLSALLGFGKRTHELRVSGEGGAAQRDVLGHYDLRTLQRLIGALGIATSVAYFLYTRSAHAHSFFGARPLVITVPFVVFGVFRFIWITSRKLDDESPTDSMLHDWPFVLNLVTYAAAILILVWQ